MHLHAAPSLAAEVPGFSQEQLDRLAHSVELRRQQLEEDINAYIRRKHDELRQYEQELVEQHRSMERDEDPAAASRRSSAESSGKTEDSATESEQPQQSQQSQQPQQPSAVPEELKKQKKHGRVHKREKELYGLVTPVFLPLLDARESTSPTKKEKKASRQEKGAAASASASASSSAAPLTAGGDARTTSYDHKPQKEAKDLCDKMAGETVKERSASDPVIKSRRSSIRKKSALRHSSTPRNRKRVSLVIDDQVVLPSDMIQEPALTSPGSETTSATNSTASLDEMIDPRLTNNDAPVYIEHHDAIHHSLPLTMTQPKTSPIKSTAPPFSNPTPVINEAAHSPPDTPSPARRSPTTAYAPPSYATRSFLDPPPERMHIEDLPSIPSTAGPDPIYPSSPSDPNDPVVNARHEENFSTYVGGISGSGVDDVNQVGSVGYPSSLGASYLESYMQSRPLSVRMAAAERDGDAAELGRLRGLEERRLQREKQEKMSKEKERIQEEDWDIDIGKGKDGDDDDFMGSMDDF